MDLDDWELSVEELDNLERDALKQIAERNASSSAATTSAASLQSTLPSAFPATYKRVSFISTSFLINTHLGIFPPLFDFNFC